MTEFDPCLFCTDPETFMSFSLLLVYATILDSCSYGCFFFILFYFIFFIVADITENNKDTVHC